MRNGWYFKMLENLVVERSICPDWARSESARRVLETLRCTDRRPNRLTRDCLVGIEACASSHHWSRELQALGHTVRLMPPAYVKPYVKRHKNDATDAEAICEAVTRPNMRFVATKTPEQQSCLTLHRDLDRSILL